MEVLLIEKDPLVRDQVKVGLQQVADVHVTVGVGYAGINEMRSKHCECVILAVDPRQKDTMKLLHHLRSFDTTTEIFVLTAPRNVRDMAHDKSKYNIHSFMLTPINPKEFFGLLCRMLERHADRDNAASRKQSRRGAPAGRGR